jgi:hypothetical protein
MLFPFFQKITRWNLDRQELKSKPFRLPAEEVCFLWYNREKAAKAKRVGNGLGTDETQA